MAEFKYLDEQGVQVIADKIKSVSKTLSDLTEVVNNNGQADAELAKKVFAGVEYNSETKRIVFKNEDGEEKGFIDATNFIKDGMVEKVEIVDGKLIITFNADSEQDEISLNLTDIFDAENYYSKDEVDEELENYVKYGEFNNHRVIYLNEDEQIGGLPKAGSGINMLQLRKYDSVEYPTVELGSTSATLTLNAKDGKVAIDGAEKQEIVATVSDVEAAKSEIEAKIEEATDDVVRYTPFGENRKTIILAEGDTVSSMGINLGMVKTYAGLNYPENSGLSGLMPVLEVGGTKGALVLNSCEDRVKVEVVENGKRVQHPVATVDDIPVLVAFTKEEIEGMFE